MLGREKKRERQKRGSNEKKLSFEPILGWLILSSLYSYIQTMIQSTMATDGPLPDLNASWMDDDMYSRRHITFALNLRGSIRPIYTIIYIQSSLILLLLLLQSTAQQSLQPRGAQTVNTAGEPGQLSILYVWVHCPELLGIAQ